MAIKAIPNQPINLQYEASETCSPLPFENCILYGQQDGNVSTQFQLLPCAENLEYMESMVGEDWNQISQFKFQHIIGSASTLKLVYDLSSYNYMKITFKVTNMSNGVFDYWINGAYVATISTNGTYSFYSTITGGTTNIEFPPYSNFDGTIEIIEVDAYSIPANIIDWVTLLDFKNNPVEDYELWTTAIVENDYVTIQIPLSYLEAGCYTIKVCDNCAELLPTEKYLNWISQIWNQENNCTDPSCLYPPNVLLNYSQLQIKSTGTIGNTISYGFYTNNFNLNFSECCYKVRIPIVSAPNVDYSISVRAGGCETQVYSNKASGSYIEYVCCTAFNDVYINFDYYEQGTSQLTWLLGVPEVIPMSDCNTNITCYTSNCFQVLPFNQLQDTRLVKGECNLFSYQMGFYWTNNFSLKQRLKLIKYAPSYEIESKDYVFSDGSKKITSAQKGKFYDIVFGGLGETEHDTLSTQILCKKFTIDNVEYFVKPDDYKPEWSKSTAYPLADVRLQAMKQGTIIFRENQN